MKRFVLTIILLLTVMSASAFAQDDSNNRIFDYDIDLGDFTTQAQLLLPEMTDEPLTLVVLVHGSGPYDMDATIFENPMMLDEPKSQNFKTIAETLSSSGYATLRYNKRGVNGLGDIDFEQLQLSTLDVLVADVNTVTNFALNIDDVTFDNIVLYGWSEGAWVISNVANERDDITALVMQGAPNGSIAEVLPYQYQEVALPYLRDVVDADGDSILSLDDVATIPQGSAQLMAQSFFFGQNASFVDTNGDGLFHIDDEVASAITMFIGNLPFFMPEIESRQDTAEFLTELAIPTLLLHGVLDGWVPVIHSEAIAETSSEAVTLLTYDDLGHALSQTEVLAEDGFGVMDDAPLTDLIAWLDALN